MLSQKPRLPATLAGMQRGSTQPPSSLWIGCGLALLGVGLSVLQSRRQQETIRQQASLLSQAQKLLVSRDSMTFQALSLPVQQLDEPDLGILDDRIPDLDPLTPEGYFDGIDPLTAGALADAGIG